MSQSASRSLSSIHSIDYTAQQFIDYLQSIKTFENFDQSTLILQSQPSTKASLHIRITEHQHVPLHEFIKDCIIIAQLYNNNEFKSILNRNNESISTCIIGINHIFELLSSDKSNKSNKSFLVSFYNQFLHFLSILTEMFDENIVSTKLRIRGPYLLMINDNDECIKDLCHFLLSQIILIQQNMNIYSNDNTLYEMSMKEMKNLRFIITFLRNLLQFELYTFNFLKFNIISNIILFQQNDNIKEWSKSLAKLFKVILMIKLPTNSLGVLSKFSTDKLILLENKAILTTKTFRSFIIKFVRFLIIHYNETINTKPFNHLDVIMEQLFNIKDDNKYIFDIINNLWSIDKLQTEFKMEYEMKQKYQSSAFLKANSMNMDDIDIDIDDLNGNKNKKSKFKLIGKKRKREEMFINKTENKTEYNQFIKEQCYIFLMDKILPFCMDFDAFYLIIIRNKFELYSEIINIINNILLHFIKTEKWWYLSHIMSLCNDLFENKTILKQYLNTLDNKDDVALNIKYGIYSYMIWICYLHQFTPKPVICFFDKDFDPEKILKHNVDEPDAKRQKLLKNTSNSHLLNDNKNTFETLKSIQERITELCLSKAIFIKLLITMNPCLMDEIINNFNHIRDRYVLIKLLKVLLHDIQFLISKDLLDYHQNYHSQFIQIFHHFKHKILLNSNKQNIDLSSLKDVILPSNEGTFDSHKIIPKNTMKSKIVFRKQMVSKLIRVKTTNKSTTNTSNNNNNNNNNDNDINTTQINPINGKPIFKHFTAQSMKIVECIVENKKHLLYQFVTNTSKSSSPSRSNSLNINNNNKKKKKTVPPPPVFQPYRKEKEEEDDNNNNNNNNNNDIPIDISFLSSTLSSIQTVLDVPQNNDNINNNYYDDIPSDPYSNNNDANIQKQQQQQQQHGNDEDFDFDFQKLSNKRKKPAPPPPTTQPINYGFYDNNNYYDGYNQRGGINYNYSSQQTQQSNFIYPSQSQSSQNKNNMNYSSNPPPKKKRKTSTTIQHNQNSINNDQALMGNDQLTDLLSYLCADDKNKNKNKNKNNNNNKKSDGSDNNNNNKNTDKLSPRYPRPKAPTMRELDIEGSEDSNWTNVVNLNRY